MWTLYDRLIKQVPGQIRIDHVHVGETWTIVHAGPYCGLAVTVNAVSYTHLDVYKRQTGALAVSTSTPYS